MILLLIAFIFNILLVRFQKVTKLRTVFTTGHVQTQQATFAFWIFLTCFPQLQYRRDPEVTSCAYLTTKLIRNT